MAARRLELAAVPEAAAAGFAAGDESDAGACGRDCAPPAAAFAAQLAPRLAAFDRASAAILEKEHAHELNGRRDTTQAKHPAPSRLWDPGEQPVNNRCAHLADDDAGVVDRHQQAAHARRSKLS